jgi:hypothetical protein
VEVYLLNVCKTFHGETDDEDDESRNITACSEGGVVAASRTIGDGRGVEDDCRKCCGWRRGVTRRPALWYTEDTYRQPKPVSRERSEWIWLVVSAISGTYPNDLSSGTSSFQHEHNPRSQMRPPSYGTYLSDPETRKLQEMTSNVIESRIAYQQEARVIKNHVLARRRSQDDGDATCCLS